MGSTEMDAIIALAIEHPHWVGSAVADGLDARIRCSPTGPCAGVAAS